MTNDWEGKGVCPYCKSQDSFRERSFVENIKSLAFYGIEFFSFSKKQRIKEAVSVAKSGNFPNFICTSCYGEVQQCGGCKEMIPYQHVGNCSKCGYC